MWKNCYSGGRTEIGCPDGARQTKLPGNMAKNSFSCGTLLGLRGLGLPFTQKFFFLIRGPIAQRQTSAKGLQF